MFTHKADIFQAELIIPITGLHMMQPCEKATAASKLYVMSFKRTATVLRIKAAECKYAKTPDLTDI